jgi:hypothetical protein
MLNLFQHPSGQVCDMAATFMMGCRIPIAIGMHDIFYNSINYSTLFPFIAVLIA